MEDMRPVVWERRLRAPGSRRATRALRALRAASHHEGPPNKPRRGTRWGPVPARLHAACVLTSVGCVCVHACAHMHLSIHVHEPTPQPAPPPQDNSPRHWLNLSRAPG